MNRLELVKALAIECDLNPASIGTLQGNIDIETQRFAHWINMAHTKIQAKTHWRWLRRRFRLNLVRSQDEYRYGNALDLETNAPITRFKSWVVEDDNPPRTHRIASTEGTSIASGVMTWFDWNDFLFTYRNANLVAGNSPSIITVNPQDQLVISPTPHADSDPTYYITGEYHASAQQLEADEDEPEMPEDYQMVIVYQALIRYAQNEVEKSTLEGAGKELKELMTGLLADQGPVVEFGEPLA